MIRWWWWWNDEMIRGMFLLPAWSPWWSSLPLHLHQPGTSRQLHRISKRIEIDFTQIYSFALAWKVINYRKYFSAIFSRYLSFKWYMHHDMPVWSMMMICACQYEIFGMSRDVNDPNQLNLNQDVPAWSQHEFKNHLLVRIEASLHSQDFFHDLLSVNLQQKDKTLFLFLFLFVHLVHWLVLCLVHLQQLPGKKWMNY